MPTRGRFDRQKRAPVQTGRSTNLVIARVAAVTAILLLIGVVWAVATRDPAPPSAAAVSAPKLTESPEPAPVETPAAASPVAAARPVAAGWLTDTSNHNTPAQHTSSFALDNSATGSVPWNGLTPSSAPASAGIMLDRQISATPAPAAGIPLEPLAGAERTDGPGNDPNP